MPALLVLRGHAHRPVGEIRPHGCDWRLGLESQRQHLIEPLKARYGEVDTMLCVYNTPHLDEVKRDYRTSPASSATLAVSGHTQRMTAVRAIEYAMPQVKEWPYDLVVMTRFDLAWKSSPFEHPGFAPDKVNFLWREWNEHCWNNHRRVCDVFQAFPADMIEPFRDAVAEVPSEVCLHLVYLPLERRVGPEKMNVILGPQIHDSNTDVDGGNPFYTIQRVR